MSQLIPSAYFYVPLFKPMSVFPILFFYFFYLNSPQSSRLLMIISVELKSQGWSYVSCMVYNKLVFAVKGVRLKYKTGKSSGKFTESIHKNSTKHLKCLSCSDYSSLCGSSMIRLQALKKFPL